MTAPTDLRMKTSEDICLHYRNESCTPLPKQNTRKDHYESHLLKSRQILKNVQKFYFNSIFAEFRNDLDFGKLLSNIIG